MNTLIKKTTAFSEKESANKTGIAKAFSEKERKTITSFCAKNKDHYRTVPASKRTVMHDIFKFKSKKST